MTTLPSVTCGKGATISTLERRLQVAVRYSKRMINRLRLLQYMARRWRPRSSRWSRLEGGLVVATLFAPWRLRPGWEVSTF
eukprot:scaffold3455_cov213-Prasinococcus_capsulatus_cf.AAC.11